MKAPIHVLARALALAAATALLLGPALLAQQPDEKQRELNNKQDYIPEFKPPENWSIKQEVRTLERSLSKYDPLIQSLGEANRDLQQDLQAFMANPNDQVLASRITMKMSSYAKKVAWDFDRVIANQDVLLNVFKELQRKLGNFNGYLDFRAKAFDRNVTEFQVKGKDISKQLKELATKYMETDDAKQKERFKRDFTRVYRSYKINSRYVEGYSRTKKAYGNLAGNMTALVKIFNTLHEAYGDLIDNLEAEKKFLMDNIRLQADSLEVQKLVREGILQGNTAIKSLTEKLAQLYLQVNTFAKVHDRINASMTKFIDTQEILVDVTRKIEQEPFGASQSIEKAIEHFYKKHDADPDEFIKQQEKEGK